MKERTISFRSLSLHAGVFVLALAIRLLFQAEVVGFTAPPQDDALLYDSIATSLSSGGPYIDAGGYYSRRAPTFPILLAGLYHVAGRSWPAARCLQAVLGALTCNLLLAAGTGRFGRRVGVTGAVLCAVFPYTIVWTGTLITEPLCTLFTTASIAALAGPAERRVAGVALWAFLTGLATLTRPNMGLLFPLGLILLAVAPGRRLRVLSLASLVFAATLLPWTARNYAVHHRFVPVTTMGGVVLWQSNNPTTAHDPALRGYVLPGDPSRDPAVPPMTEVDQDEYFFHKAVSFMAGSPSEMPGLVGAKIVRLWNPFPRMDSAAQRWAGTLSFVPVLVLFVTGMAIAFARRDRRVLPFLLPVVVVMMTTVVYWSDARMRAPADPMIVLLAAYGFWSFRERPGSGGALV